MEIRQPKSEYILVPSHSSEKREYIPIGFESPDTISTNANFTIPDASLYLFGVLTSKIHMAWVRAVCGRIKSDYRYSKDVVYNNFPFPEPSESHIASIEKAAQSVLDVRQKYSDVSLGDLYGNLTLFPELRKAHDVVDKAVEKAYGRKFADEAEIVAYLMEEYQRLVGEKE